MPNIGANLIFILHCLFVLFILLVPWTDIPILLILHITFCISLFIHWKMNSDACCLTVLEGQMYGIRKPETFMQRLTSPIYTIDDNMVYFLTFVLMCISMYKLYRNRYKFTIAWNCYTHFPTNLPDLTNQTIQTSRSPI